jgi:hypothetical protein
MRHLKQKELIKICICKVRVKSEVRITSLTKLHPLKIIVQGNALSDALNSQKVNNKLKQFVSRKNRTTKKKPTYLINISLIIIGSKT